MAAQGLAATRAFGGPISASAFQHYLGATGAYLALPVDELLDASPELIAELNTVLIRVSAAAVGQVRSAPASTCTSEAFSSGWLGHPDPADNDWHFTLGRFYYQVLGTAFRVNAAASGSGAVQVTYRAAIGDTYNFDPGSAFEQFGQLAVDGRAADFLDGGATTSRTSRVKAGSTTLDPPGFG